MNWTW